MAAGKPAVKRLAYLPFGMARKRAKSIRRTYRRYFLCEARGVRISARLAIAANASVMWSLAFGFAGLELSSRHEELAEKTIELVWFPANQDIWNSPSVWRT